MNKLKFLSQSVNYLIISVVSYLIFLIVYAIKDMRLKPFKRSLLKLFFTDPQIFGT